ncbi:MAG: DUF1365 domain-containing protein [Proteobacteria bacterium]|nr:DUF1365 domain-containing protein [Pseudomonadota bacterium]MBI3497518.1 DUF1365 domain-containing protein [Pseudomonadota bacterium]
MQRSALYLGEVMHRRLGAIRHRFTYRVFSLLVDLDELDGLAKRLRLFSRNRFNLFSFFDADHGPRDGRPLRPWVESQLSAAGLAIAGGPIRLLAFPRVLGYAFNPISLYFCHHKSGALAAILYDVRNTLGEKHGYLMKVESGHAPGRPIRHACDKAFYVSPFIPMGASYRFRVMAPEDRYALVIREQVQDRPILVATHTARRQALTDRALLATFFAYPLMTVKVIGGIHWQALRLWIKGARLEPRPAPPEAMVSFPAEPCEDQGAPDRHAAD